MNSKDKAELYDVLGKGYRPLRQPDPRIASTIVRALGDARSIANLGAGAGSYEPTDRTVLAVEPSLQMLRQRPSGSAPAVRAHAECIPCPDRAFDAAMAVLTVHHWTDWRAGVREMRRVAKRVAILTWDPTHPGFWLVQDYLPDLRDYDRRIFPPIEEVVEELGGAKVTPVAVPHDCTDGFLGAYWRRPERYLDPGTRAAISSFARVADTELRLAGLRADLDSGAWRERNEHLLDRTELDLGYRLVATA